MINNQLTREELIIYLRNMFNSSLAKNEAFATPLVNTACDIYPEELMPEIELGALLGHLEITNAKCVQ